MNNYSKFLVGVLAGAAAGVVVGLILAPDKGSETRKKISEKAGKLADAILHKAEETLDKVSEKTVKG